MPVDPLSATFAALSDPTRRAILGRLEAGETSVLELAKPFDMTLPAGSQHLKVLERGGLITPSPTARGRRCGRAAGPLKDVADGVEHYRSFGEESFARLDAYLKEVQAAEAERGSKDRED